MIQKSKNNPILKDWSLWFLLLSNIVTIILAIEQNWSIQTLIFIFLCQSAIIGIFNVAKMLSVNDERRKFQVPFFILHYGFFHFGYFMFVFRAGYLEAITPNMLPIAAAILTFFVNHTYSYYINRKRDKEKYSLDRLMGLPYLRIVPMHIIIITGGFIVGGGKYLLLFLGLKTLADLIMHRVEHK